jgi:anti-anti-sigma factor
MAGISIEVTHAPAECVVWVGGDVDAQTSPLLDLVSTESSFRPAAVIVDASGISFIDASGLRALERLGRRVARSRRTFWVRDPSRCLVTLLDLGAVESELRMEGDAGDVAGRG